MDATVRAAADDQRVFDAMCDLGLADGTLTAPHARRRRPAAARLGSAARTPGGPVLGFLALLLVIWIVLIVVGAIVHGLFWLIIIGVVLFLATSAFGVLRGRGR